MLFKEFKLKSWLLDNLSQISFYNVTEVQSKVIPEALKSRSLMVESKTGSGKTHAFLIPIVEKIDASLEEVQAVIISPTRELALQIYDRTLELIKGTNITVAKAIGGVSRDQELKKYDKAQPMIVIGTLGRINDLAITNNVLKIYKAKTIVIDEADMVFEEKEMLEVDRLMSLIQSEPQFLIFSATIPKGLRMFLNKYLFNILPIVIEEENLTTINIEHKLIQCKAKKKEDILLSLLSIINPYLCIIFVNTKEKVDELAYFLADNNYRVGKIHGSMEDRIRRQMIRRIKDNEFQYIVASDIASRGIDIEGVSHVINFELPQDVEQYIHRTGRTARFDQTGISYSLYDYDDDDYVQLLRSKGLKPVFIKIQAGEFIETKLEKKPVKKTLTKTLEDEYHTKFPLPKKVKPGYRKKRAEEIKKKIKKAKKATINEGYRKKARNGK